MDNAYFVYIWSFLSTITVSCCENDDLMSQLILHDLFVLTLHISPQLQLSRFSGLLSYSVFAFESSTICMNMLASCLTDN